MTLLHYIGDFFRNLFLAVPLGLVQALFIFLYLLLLVWVLKLPREKTGGDPEVRDRAPSANLKLWAAVAIIAQIVIYALL